MEEQDIIYQDDMVVRRGDFYVANSNNQNVEHNLIADEGNFFQSPLVGIGINRYINSTSSEAKLRRIVTSGLNEDDFRLDRLEFVPDDDGNVEIFYNATKRK